MDATLVEVNSGMYRIVASKVDHNLGGDSFDEILMNLFKQEFYRYLSSYFIIFVLSRFFHLYTTSILLNFRTTGII